MALLHQTLAVVLASACVLVLAGCGRAPAPEHLQDAALDAAAPPVEGAGERPPLPRAAAIVSPAALLDGPEAYLCRMVDRRAARLYQTFAKSRAPDPRPFDEGD